MVLLVPSSVKLTADIWLALCYRATSNLAAEAQRGGGCLEQGEDCHAGNSKPVAHPCSWKSTRLRRIL